MKRAFVPLIAALAVAGPAHAEQGYTDATGEDAAAADVAAVTVSNNTKAKTLTFKTQVSNMPTFEDGASFEYFIDADRNPETGSGGFEYLVTAAPSDSELERYDDAEQDFVVVAGFSAQKTYAGGILTLTFGLDAIGSPEAFDFAVFSFRGDDASIDSAPDDEARFTYTLTAAPAAGTPPPPPPTTRPQAPLPAGVSVKRSRITVTAAPRAGKTLKVASLLVDLSDGTSARASEPACTATLGGVKLKGTGVGRCTFALPRKAKGKKLVVNVAGRFAGAALAKTATYTVK